MAPRRLALIAAAAALASAAASTAPACGSKSCAAPGACPTDAPTSTMYGPGSYPAHEAMVDWSCVFSIADFPGTPDAAFAAAAAAAAASPAGGVVFFPPGRYSFTKLMQLPSNVVVRGAPTTAAAKVGKLPGPLAPRSVLTCPPRSHLGFFSLGANRTGVVSLELDGCAVMLWPELLPGGATFNWPTDFEDYWFFAKNISALGTDKLVLSNLIHDVSFGYPSPASPPAGQNVVPWVFSTAIAAYGDANILVSNNLLAKASGPPLSTTLALKLRNGTTAHAEGVIYPTDNRYGIDVGRVLIGAVASAVTNPGGPCPDGQGSGGSITPECFPALFPVNVTVRDNYVYQNGRVGISLASGLPQWPPAGGKAAPGSGAQVFNNHVEVAANTTCWTVDGVHATYGSDTNENRGYDIAGYGKNMTANSGHINTQSIAPWNGPYTTVDGEGILQQPGQNSAGFFDAFVSNDLSGSGSGGPIWYFDVLEASDGVFFNNTSGGAFVGIWECRSQDTATGFVAAGNTPAAQICNACVKPERCTTIPGPAGGSA